MKKIIALFVFMLAFGLSANAQQKAPKQDAKTSMEQKLKDAAAKDVAILMEVVELDAQDKESFFSLFVHKHRALQENLSDERKTELTRVMKAKIEATLDADQKAKLAQSPATLEKLIH